jgi:hypothetical protein
MKKKKYIIRKVRNAGLAKGFDENKPERSG